MLVLGKGGKKTVWIVKAAAVAKFSRGKTWHSEDFSKFGHFSEFKVFSLENIESLVLNLRPGSVY